MDNDRFKHATTTARADHGPLPAGVESDSETLLKMFIELDEQHTSSFMKTQPSTIAPVSANQQRPLGGYSVQEVMAEARRHGRVCPSEAEWQNLQVLLGPGAPASLRETELKHTPPLLRRIRLRDQVEWAAEKRRLPEVMDFLQQLREDQWMHMGT